MNEHASAQGRDSGAGGSRTDGPQRTRHDGDCTIYAAMMNGEPTDGICVCGYGWQEVYKGDWSKMYSAERLAAMQGHQNEGLTP